MFERNNAHIMDGIFLVDKPSGVTSRDVVDDITRRFQTKKVGHTGTLDPFATGLMICTIGKGTKLGPFIEDLKKGYTATLKLGQKTDTGDLTGKVTATSEVIALYRPLIEDTLQMMVGKQLQTPPMYSAIKKDGVPLYQMAREGKTIERTARPIEIFETKLDSLTDDHITFSVVCSKGTYIRTLGESLAEKLGMVGHLTALRRTMIGNYKVSEAVPVERLTTASLIAPYNAMRFMYTIAVPDAVVQDIKDGKIQKLNTVHNVVLLISSRKELLAVYERRPDGLFHAVRGLF